MQLAIFAALAATYLMIISKRIPALIRAFRYQSLSLFIITLIMALAEKRVDLFIIAGLLFAVKVIFIPFLLNKVTTRTRASQDLGLFINPQLSLFWALGFTYLSWIFTVKFVSLEGSGMTAALAVAFFIVLSGLFLMIFRMTALAQIVGILVMENGLFLLAAVVSGGMPFFVEIAIFFDVFVSVLIMGFFVYRINKLFTHIDVNKLSRLKG